MSVASAPAAPTSLPWLGLTAVLMGTFISTLNGRISTFGLADVEGAIHAGFDEGAWITTAQTVAQMLIAPVAIWAGGAYGPRRVLLAASLSFALISALSPFAVNLPEMLVMKFLGGVASGFFIPLTIGYILMNTPPRLWAYGIAIYALNLEFSLNISASLEGWYIDNLSWRWIFWQNVPIALVMAACLFYGSKSPPINPNRPPADIFGLMSSGIGLSLIYAALDQGNRLDWLNSGLVWGLLLSGILLVIAFIIHDAVTPYPLINLKVAATHPLPSMLGLIAFLRLSILSTAFLIPQYLGAVRGFRSLEVGQTLIWIALPQFLICPLAGLFLRRIDPRIVASIGFILISVACYMVAHGLTPLWASPQFLVSQLLQALGQSFALTGVIFFGIQYIRPQDAVTFGAMLQTARLMGGEVGQAAVTTVARVRGQTASNLIGLHVQSGDGQVEQRIQAYAAATRAAGYAASGEARGTGVLAGVVHRMAATQAVVDAFELLSGLAAVALLLVVAQRAAPPGPATHRSLFASKDKPAL